MLALNFVLDLTRCAGSGYHGWQIRSTALQIGKGENQSLAQPGASRGGKKKDKTRLWLLSPFRFCKTTVKNSDEMTVSAESLKARIDQQKGRKGIGNRCGFSSAGK